MDILERIKMIMKMNQLNAATFADRIGVQRSNVSHVLTGRNKPSLVFIEKILQEFPKVNALWLISGNIQAPVKELGLKEAPQVTKVINNLNPLNTFVDKVGISKDTNVINEDCEIEKSKKIIKIITFYEDFTFDEYKPKA